MGARLKGWPRTILRGLLDMAGRVSSWTRSADSHPPATLVRGWIVPVLLLGTMAYAIAEEITLTTYYPSPRGVYDQLRTAGNVQWGSITPPGEPGGPPNPPPRVYVAQDVTPDPFDDPAALVAPAFQVDRRESDGTTTTLTPLLVVDEQGNLDVAGPIRVADGTQGLGKVLRSDVDGVASWSVLDPQARPFTAAGTSSWRVPAGVTRVKVQVWGAGAAGGSGDGSESGCGGGGGGSGYAEGFFPVTPDTDYAVVVGAGGTGYGGAGGESAFGLSAQPALIGATGGPWLGGANSGGEDSSGGRGGMGYGGYLNLRGGHGLPINRAGIELGGVGIAPMTSNDQYGVGAGGRGYCAFLGINEPGQPGMVIISWFALN